MNHFSTAEAARRYAEGRPGFHHLVAERIGALNEGRQFARALDVACGNGLSSVALLPIADEVCATDASAEMLSRTLSPEKIRYQLAPAEKQPFPDHYFDLVTVCSGVHWFEVDQFLSEAKRLLTENGLLVIYDNFFCGEMLDNVDFPDWYRIKYLVNFPPPPRNDHYDWSPANVLARGFKLKEEEFKNNVQFTLPQLILYLTTQSNVNDAVLRRGFSYKQVEQWLQDELSGFYQDATPQEFSFGNLVRYLVRDK